MNKIYRVIWNHATNAFVVVSELNKTKGKTKSIANTVEQENVVALNNAASSHSATLGAWAQAAFVAIGTMTALEAQASVRIGYTSGTSVKEQNTIVSTTGGESIAIGGSVARTAAKAGGTNAIAIGRMAEAGTSQNSGNDVLDGIAIGNSSKATEKYAVAMGSQAEATKEGAIAIGRKANAAGTGQDGGIAIGNEAKGGGADATALGNNADASGEQATALGNGTFATNNATAVGNGAQATQESAIAMGKSAQGTEVNSIAIGTDSIANSENSTASGTGASATGVGSMATGTGATTDGDNAMATGTSAIANATNATATGTGAQATAENATAIGTNASASEVGAIAVGTGSIANQTNATAIGTGAIADLEGSVAIGSGSVASAGTAETGTTVNGVAYNGFNGALTDPNMVVNFGNRQLQGVASGNISATSTDVVNGSQLYIITDGLQTSIADLEAKVNQKTATYFHVNSTSTLNRDSVEAAAQANAADSMAAGVNATAAAANAVVIGTNAIANTGATDSVVIGLNAVANNGETVAIGKYATASGDSSVALGWRSATTATQSGAFGGWARAYAQAAYAIGYYALADGVRSLAIGSSTGGGADKAHASGTDSIAIGTNASALAQNAIAMGRDNNVTGTQSIAIGTGNTVSGNNSGAFGDPNKITSDGSYVVGNNNTVTTNDTFVLGSGINRAADLTTDLGGTVENSVYLGKDSEATKGTAVGTAALNSAQAAGATTTAGDKGTVSTATVSGVTYGNFAGATANGVVTVGASGSERRIQNVAAGEISATSTDAINGSQLYMVANGTLQQMPVVYTKADGTRVYKQPNGTFVDAAGNPVTAGDVIGSMNNGSGSTTSPMTLANVEGNLDGAKTGTTAPTTSATKPTTLNKNNAATVGDVLNAGWNLQENNTAKDFVTPYNTVNFINGSGTVVSITSDGETSKVSFDINIDSSTLTQNTSTGAVEVNIAKLSQELSAAGVITGENGITVKQTKDANGNATVVVSANVTPLNVTALGKVEDPSATDGKLLVNATTVANAINDSGFTLTSSAATGGTKDASSSADEVINPGEIIDMTAGKNMVVKQEANGKITYSTAENVSFTNTNVSNALIVGDATNNVTITKNNVTVGNTVVSNGTVSNLTTHLTQVFNATTSNPTTTTPTGDTLKEAATVGDVLYSGWNLQNNGDAKDFVTHGDTVDFANGTATVANVTTDGNGKTTIKYDVQVDDSTIKVVNGKLTATVQDTNTVTSLENSDTTTVSSTITNGNPTYKVEVNKATANTTLTDTPDASDITITKAGKVAAPTNTTIANNNFVTAQVLTDVVNSAGFTLKTSATTGGTRDTASITSELIKAGDTLDMVAGKNMVVRQDASGKVTYSTADEVEFDKVTVGTVEIDKTSGINAGGKKITNVKAGEDDTDAVNVSQLKSSIQSAMAGTAQELGDLNIRMGEMDKDLRAGIASAVATAGLPQAYLPGKSLIAIGGGTYKGEAGYAIGLSSISDNGSWIVKGTAAGNSRGGFTTSAAVGYQW